MVERPPLASLLACRTDAVATDAAVVSCGTAAAAAAAGTAAAAADAGREAQAPAQVGEAWAVFVSPRCEVQGTTHASRREEEVEAEAEERGAERH